MGDVGGWPASDRAAAAESDQPAKFSKVWAACRPINTTGHPRRGRWTRCPSPPKTRCLSPPKTRCSGFQAGAEKPVWQLPDSGRDTRPRANKGNATKMRVCSQGGKQSGAGPNVDRPDCYFFSGSTASLAAKDAARRVTSLLGQYVAQQRGVSQSWTSTTG